MNQQHCSIHKSLGCLLLLSYSQLQKQQLISKSN